MNNLENTRTPHFDTHQRIAAREATIWATPVRAPGAGLP